MIGFLFFLAPYQIEASGKMKHAVSQTNSPGLQENFVKPDLLSLNTSNHFYEETAFKRSEIIFFLSLPFIFLAHVIAVGTTYYLAEQDETFSGLPTEPFLFAGVSSLMLTGGIIYLDFQKNAQTHGEGQRTSPTLRGAEKYHHRFRMRYTYRF